jgi:hypothetical protein
MLAEFAGHVKLPLTDTMDFHEPSTVKPLPCYRGAIFAVRRGGLAWHPNRIRVLCSYESGWHHSSWAKGARSQQGGAVEGVQPDDSVACTASACVSLFVLPREGHFSIDYVAGNGPFLQ